MTTPYTDRTRVATIDSGGALTWDRPADQLRANAEAAYERVRNDPALSDQARRAMIAAIYMRLQADMTKLQQSAGVRTASDLAALKRAVYGVDDLTAGASPAEQTSIAIAFRDAQDRASQIRSEDEATRMLTAATQSGDETLAQAVFNAACAGGPFYYGSVVDSFLASRPAKARAYTALRAAEKPANAATMFEYVVPVPPDLAGLNDNAIGLLADQANGYQRTT